MSRKPVKHTGFLLITPSGRYCLSTYLRPIGSKDGQSVFADGPAVCEQTVAVTST